VSQKKRAKTAPATSGVKPFYYVLAGIALIGAILIGLTIFRSSDAAMDPNPELAKATSEDLVAQAKGVTRGDPNSPVKLMVFSDYQCPGCGVFASTMEPQIRATFGDRVTEIYHDFPLIQIHKYAFLAARAGRCAEDQQKFWEVHDIIFARQRDWSFAATAPVKKFEEYAGQAGLDVKAFSECLGSDKHTDLVTANLELGQRVGVGSTPTVYINGRASANPLSWDILKREIEQAVGTTPTPNSPADSAAPAPTDTTPAVTGQ
jgi:protein-disulfide isomerase